MSRREKPGSEPKEKKLGHNCDSLNVTVLTKNQSQKCNFLSIRLKNKRGLLEHQFFADNLGTFLFSFIVLLNKELVKKDLVPCKPLGGKCAKKPGSLGTIDSTVKY